MSTTQHWGALVPAIAALVAGASFGVNGTFSQIVAAQGFTLQHIAILQFICGAVILGVVALIKREPLPSPRDLIGLLIVGVLQGASALSYYFAIDSLSVGQAVAIQFQYVWIAVFIQNAVERSLPSKWVVISTVVIICGTLLGSGLADEMIAGELGTISLAGVAFAVACAFFYALFIYLNGRFAKKQPTVSRTFYVAIGAVLVTSIASPDFYLGACDVAGLAPYALFMGVLATIIPCSCLAVAGKRLPGGIVAILTSAELPAAVASGCLLLGEPISVLRVVGIVLILASIVLSEMDELLPSKRNGQPAPSAPKQNAPVNQQVKG